MDSGGGLMDMLPDMDAAPHGGDGDSAGMDAGDRESHLVARAREAGAQARAAGRPEGSNPHNFNLESAEHNAWGEGWNDPGSAPLREAAEEVGRILCDADSVILFGSRIAPCDIEGSGPGGAAAVIEAARARGCGVREVKDVRRRHAPRRPASCRTSSTRSSRSPPTAAPATSSSASAESVAGFDGARRRRLERLAKGEAHAQKKEDREDQARDSPLREGDHRRAADAGGHGADVGRVISNQLRESLRVVEDEMAEEMEVRQFKESQPPDGVVLEIGGASRTPRPTRPRPNDGEIRGYRSPTAGRPIR